MGLLLRDRRYGRRTEVWVYCLMWLKYVISRFATYFRQRHIAIVHRPWFVALLCWLFYIDYAPLLFNAICKLGGGKCHHARQEAGIWWRVLSRRPTCYTCVNRCIEKVAIVAHFPTLNSQSEEFYIWREPHRCDGAIFHIPSVWETEKMSDIMSVFRMRTWLQVSASQRLTNHGDAVK